jgi:hypothetical protein
LRRSLWSCRLINEGLYELGLRLNFGSELMNNSIVRSDSHKSLKPKNYFDSSSFKLSFFHFFSVLSSFLPVSVLAFLLIVRFTLGREFRIICTIIAPETHRAFPCPLWGG